MPKKILIVDDDTELCQELSEILRDEGYLVDEISDSMQAEYLIKQNSYGIYLFDYKMTGLNGVDLLRKVKEKDSKSVVFIISGRPFIEKLLEEENVSHLVSGVITKPFDIEMLVQKIKASI